MTAQIPGHIFGQAGASLAEGSFLADKSTQLAGLQAEYRTANILNALSLKGPSVAHDLDLPFKNVGANIDHVIVFGSNVLIIDSKQWSGNYFYTIAGRTFRDRELFTPADKKTLPMASQALSGFFARNNIHGVNILTPIMCVWGSGLRNFALFRPPGAKAVRGEQLRRYLSRNVTEVNARADVLMALASLQKKGP